MRYRAEALAVLVVLFAAALPLTAQDRLITSFDLQRSITDEYRREPLLSGEQITVRLEGDLALLTGQVESERARERAVELALWTVGVRGVVNLLEVRPAEPPRAGEVRDRLARAFTGSSYAPDLPLRIEVEDGVVLLSGVAASWQERQQAEAIVRGMAGVTEVVNELTVQTEANRTDSAIRRDIRMRLAMDPTLMAEVIEISVDNGDVRLEGVVNSEAASGRASALAWVIGVDSVDNNLTVDPSRQPLRRSTVDVLVPPSELRETVRRALALDPRVPPTVWVDVEELGVRLAGEVTTTEQAAAATETASNVLGVYGVENELEIAELRAPSDQALTLDVQAVLQSVPTLEQEEIAVRVVDGVAYLLGEVRSAELRREAGDAAALVRGIAGVENNLRIVLPENPRDEEIEEAIRENLVWNPLTRDAEVAVSVDEGVARLSGEVNSLRQRQAVVDEALQSGVTAVVSTDLRVG